MPCSEEAEDQASDQQVGLQAIPPARRVILGANGQRINCSALATNQIPLCVGSFMRMSGRRRLVDEGNETSPRAHEFSVGLAHDGKQGAFLDGNPVAIDAKGCESEHGGTGPAAQCQPYPSVHQDPSAIGRMADQRVRPCSNNCLVRLGAYVAREGGAQKPPAVSAENPPPHKYTLAPYENPSVQS